MFNATFRYPVAAAAAALGSSRAHYFTRQQEEEHHRKHQHVLPSGEIRGCCCDLPDSVRIHEMKKQYDDGVLATSRSQVLSTSTDPLSIRLREIVGPEHCIGPDSSSQVLALEKVPPSLSCGPDHFKKHLKSYERVLQRGLS